jgi:tetratricopeptide (TPR) repeat protein
VAAALLAAGADADAADANGHTPLRIAAALGDAAMTALLMRGAKRDTRVTPWEADALIAAVKEGRLEPQGKSTQEAATERSEERSEAVPPAPAPADAPKAAAAPRPPPPSPEAAAAAAAAKATGDAAFGRGDFGVARASYDAAIAADPSDAALFANRSVAALSAGDVPAAIADGERACALRPDWPKAAYRLGAALHAAERYEDAANALFTGVQLGGGDDLARAFTRAVEAGRKQYQEGLAKGAQ